MRPLVLVGFMASGKSSVAMGTAREMGWPAVDLDARIEERAGLSVAEIFASCGEDGFRARERQELERVLGGEKTPMVLATGGGTACQPGIMDKLKGAAVVVHLAADFEELRRRVEAAGAKGAERPLWSRSEEKLRALHRERLPHYMAAHATLDTSGRSASEIGVSLAHSAQALERFPRRRPYARCGFGPGPAKLSGVGAKGAFCPRRRALPGGAAKRSPGRRCQRQCCDTTFRRARAAKLGGGRL